MLDLKVALVTGGTGFIGPHVCLALRDQGWDVRAAVRRHGTLLAPGCREVLVGDISSSIDWHDHLSGVDTVVDLVASGDASLRLARSAADVGVASFVFASTVKVHGNSGCRGWVDERSPIRPDDDNARSKAEAECGLEDIASSGGIAITALRPPLVIGPGVKANFLRMIRWVANGVPLPLDSIRNRRSVIYVGNLASAVVACSNAVATGFRSFVVADDPPYSTPTLIRSLADALDVPARLVPCPRWLVRGTAAALGRRADAARLLDSLVVDSSAFREQLSWIPPFSIEQGLVATARWYRETYR